MRNGLKTSLSRLAVAVLSLLAIYVGSYLGLSAGGRYEPACIGLGGVTTYAWAPTGFVTEFRWRHPLMYAYLPLYCIDIHWWHTDEKAESGQYPINEVEPKDVWKLYKASGF